jgi:hypothetical protein
VEEVEGEDRRLARPAEQWIPPREVYMWRAAAGDPYPMEKNEDEIPMFARFAERGLSLPVSNFFKGLMGYYVLTVKIRQPSHEFTFGVGISFIPYPLVLTPVV